MKKTLLLTMLLVTSYQLFAFTTQGVWRWRNDDGSETSATWKADQNTPITISSTGDNIRLRIEMYNNGDGGLGDAFLEDSVPGVPGWDTLRVTPTSSAFMIAGTSPFVTDAERTTEQLNGQGAPWAFTPGYEIVSRDTIPKFTLGTDQKTEIEWVIKPSSNIQPSTTYFFRVDAANYSDGYVYPSLTTSGTLPVNIVSFNATASKNSVLISWTTATETNNSHFDIERSTDGKNYSKIATVQGNGTSSMTHTYQVFDGKPLNGINYYRIKQYDLDGKYGISDVRSVKMALQNYLMKVYPNPTPGDIRFTLNNYNGTSVIATLQSNAGRTMHQETIQLNGSGSYKLNLQSKLPAGVYFLQLKGDALSENIKVIVQ